MTRYLAIDVGVKRHGLAISDAGGTLASPLATIESSGRLEQDFTQILREAEVYGVDEFVVGLPLNMDDSEGPQAKLARQFGQRLAEASRKRVHFWDERLSTFAADELLRESEGTRKKKKARRDRVAAQQFLQAFLDAQPPLRSQGSE